MMRLRQHAAVIVLITVVGAGLLCGCGSTEITASTSCKTYLEQSDEARHDAAVRISSEIPGVSDPGNPMYGLSVDAACGSDPDMTIGQYFGAGAPAANRSGTSAQSTRLTAESNCAQWNAADPGQRQGYVARAVGQPVEDHGHYTLGGAQGFLDMWWTEGCQKATASGNAATTKLADIGTGQDALKAANGG